MKVFDLTGAMESIAPTAFAASWDNVGLLVGDPSADIARVLIAIDCTRAVLDEATRLGCEAIVTYHPPLFEAQKKFLAGSVAYEAARAHVAIYSPHTALDVADGGTNDVLADAVGLTEREPLRVVMIAGAMGRRGFGRVGFVPAIGMGDVIDRLKQALRVAHVLAAGGLRRSVSRVAVCAGSGGEFVADAIGAGAQLLVTGEMRHHDVLRAVAAGMGVVCTRHTVSERVALVALERSLAASLPGVVFSLSEEDREPLEFA